MTIHEHFESILTLDRALPLHGPGLFSTLLGGGVEVICRHDHEHHAKGLDQVAEALRPICKTGSLPSRAERLRRAVDEDLRISEAEILRFTEELDRFDFATRANRLDYIGG